MSYVFISYSHKDADYAHKLADKLQSNGFNVWIDARLDYGSQWPHEIQSRLDACDAFILVMSPRSFASEWVQSELQRAKRKLKPIFPLLLEGDEPWLSTESTQYYDVRGGTYPDARFYSALGKIVPVSQNAQTFTGLPKPPVTITAPLQTEPKKKTNKTGLALAVLGGGAAFLGLCAVILLGIWFLNLGGPPAAPATQVVIVTATLSDSVDDSVLIPVTNSTQTPTERPSPVPPTSTPVSTSTSTSTFTPVPTSTNIPTATPKLNTSIYIEAEDGEVGNGAYVDSHPSARDSLYVNFNKAGTLKFTIYDFAAGQYNLVIHYAKYVNNTPDYSDPGYQYLYVNNTGPNTITYFKTMGDEDGSTWRWKDKSVNLSLERGTNTLILENGYPGVSVDYIQISR